MFLMVSADLSDELCRHEDLWPGDQRPPGHQAYGGQARGLTWRLISVAEAWRKRRAARVGPERDADSGTVPDQVGRTVAEGDVAGDRVEVGIAPVGEPARAGHDDAAGVDL